MCNELLISEINDNTDVWHGHGWQVMRSCVEVRVRSALPCSTLPGPGRDTWLRPPTALVAASVMRIRSPTLSMMMASIHGVLLLVLCQPPQRTCHPRLPHWHLWLVSYDQFLHGIIETQSYIAADATVPGIYHRAFAVVDPSGLGDISVNSLSRVLTASGLPASTIDRVCLFVLRAYSIIYGCLMGPFLFSDCEFG